MKRFLGELGCAQERYVLYCDSQSAIHLGKNSTFHGRYKHIDVRYHWIRDVLDSKLLELEKIHTNDNGSDMIVKITRLEGTPFTTLALANGNHWVACGDGHSLMEVNLDNGEVARRYGENDIKGVRLFFVAGLLPAKDGGLYVCNWQGHDKNAVEANSPQVFEINDKGEVIWNLNDNEKFGMISTISTIE